MQYGRRLLDNSFRELIMEFVKPESENYYRVSSHFANIRIDLYSNGEHAGNNPTHFALM